MNSFKTIRQGQGKVVSIVKPVIEDVFQFPVLSDINTNTKKMCFELDYKNAMENQRQVAKVVETEEESIPEGWVRYTVDKKTKMITVEEPVSNEEEEPFSEEHRQEATFRKMMNALSANWKRNREEFIECHGEEYYNDLFLTRSCYDELEYEE